jgi:hypothetical protein
MTKAIRVARVTAHARRVFAGQPALAVRSNSGCPPRKVDVRRINGQPEKAPASRGLQLDGKTG